MGADGGITIYDYDKFTSGTSKQDKTLFENHALASNVYVQDLQGKEYLTVYHGGNGFFNLTLIEIMTYYDPKKDTFPNSLSGDIGYLFDGVTKKERQKLAKMVAMLETCRLAYWEVWT